MRYHLTDEGPKLCLDQNCSFGEYNHYSDKNKADQAWKLSNAYSNKSNDSSRIIDSDLDPDILTPEEIRIFSKMNGRHLKTSCKGQTCIIHNPLPHHMRYWEIVWHKGNAAIMRVCPHGQEHVDLSVIPFLRRYPNLRKNIVHDCDGCCKE